MPPLVSRLSFCDVLSSYLDSDSSRKQWSDVHSYRDEASIVTLASEKRADPLQRQTGRLSDSRRASVLTFQF